jgi:large subunit ribosomal protein L17
VFSYLGDKIAVKELFTVVAPKICKPPRGYSVILKLGIRPGDNAELAMTNWLTLTMFTVR